MDHPLGHGGMDCANRHSVHQRVVGRVHGPNCVEIRRRLWFVQAAETNAQPSRSYRGFRREKTHNGQTTGTKDLHRELFLSESTGSIALEPEYSRNPGRQVQPRYDSAIFLTSELFAKERADQRLFVPSCGDSEQFLPNQTLLANQSQWAQRDSVPNREAAPRRYRCFKTPQARRKRLLENNVLIQDTTVFSRVPT